MRVWSSPPVLSFPLHFMLLFVLHKKTPQVIKKQSAECQAGPFTTYVTRKEYKIHITLLHNAPLYGLRSHSAHSLKIV